MKGGCLTHMRRAGLVLALAGGLAACQTTAPQTVMDAPSTRAVFNALVVVKAAAQAAGLTQPPEIENRKAVCVVQAATPDEAATLARDADTDAMRKIHIDTVLRIVKRQEFKDCLAA